MIKNYDIDFRLAQLSDSRLLFNWFNSKNELRFKLNSTKFVQYLKHKFWLKKKIKSSSCSIWIIEKKGKAVGQVRVEKEKKSINTDIFVDKNYRNFGVGNKALIFAIKKSKEKWNKKNITVYISKYNYGSIKLFKSVGFKLKKLERSFFIFHLQN